MTHQKQLGCTFMFGPETLDPTKNEGRAIMLANAWMDLADKAAKDDHDHTFAVNVKCYHFDDLSKKPISPSVYLPVARKVINQFVTFWNEGDGWDMADHFRNNERIRVIYSDNDNGEFTDELVEGFVNSGVTQACGVETTLRNRFKVAPGTELDPRFPALDGDVEPTRTLPDYTSRRFG